MFQYGKHEIHIRHQDTFFLLFLHVDMFLITVIIYVLTIPGALSRTQVGSQSCSIQNRLSALVIIILITPTEKVQAILSDGGEKSPS